MKKYLRLLFLFLLPLTLAACSEDEEKYVDLQIPGKSIEGIVEVTGYVYNQEGSWYLNTNLREFRDIYSSIYFGDEDCWDIKIRNYPSDVILESIEEIEKTFTTRLTLYKVEHGPMFVVEYLYVADIYEIK